MTGVTGYATLTRLIPDSRRDACTGSTQLTNQASTGLIADNYAGLGTGAPVSLDLQPQIANLQTWQNNVDAATGRMSVAQSALTQIQSIAADFYAQLNNVQGVNASAVDTIAASARDALSQVASLLNTQDGGVYVFAGQDTANPPVPDRDNILQLAASYAQINAGGQPAWPPTARRRRRPRRRLQRRAPTSPARSPFSDLPVAAMPRCRPLPTVQVGQNQTETVGTAGQRQRLIPDSPPVHLPCRRSASHHRLLHARRAAGAGDDRLAQQRAGERPRLPGPGAGYTHQPVRSDRRHGAGRRCAGQRAVVAHRDAEPAGRHRRPR